MCSVRRYFAVMYAFWHIFAGFSVAQEAPRRTVIKPPTGLVGDGTKAVKVNMSKLPVDMESALKELHEVKGDRAEIESKMRTTKEAASSAASTIAESQRALKQRRLELIEENPEIKAMVDHIASLQAKLAQSRDTLKLLQQKDEKLNEIENRGLSASKLITSARSASVYGVHDVQRLTSRIQFLEKWIEDNAESDDTALQEDGTSVHKIDDKPSVEGEQK